MENLIFLCSVFCASVAKHLIVFDEENVEKKYAFHDKNCFNNIKVIANASTFVKKFVLSS